MAGTTGALTPQSPGATAERTVVSPAAGKHLLPLLGTAEPSLGAIISCVRRAEYGRLLTAAYDLDKPEAPPDELAFYTSYIERYGEPVLELMSGSGRFLGPLVTAGFDIDGVDASADMLDACVRRYPQHNLSGRLHEQFLHELDLPRRYAFAFCGAGSFGLLVDQAEIAESLARIRRHLLPGGWFLLEFETPLARHDWPDGQWTGRWWRRADGATIALRGTTDYDAATQVEHGLGIYELFVESRLVETELDDWAQRYWDAEDIVAVLERAGFAEVTVSAAFTTRAPTAQDVLLSVLAHNPPSGGEDA